MGVFDIILAGVLIIALVLGYISGLMRQLGVVLGLLFGVLFTDTFSPLTIKFIKWITSQETIISERVSYIITFAVIFITVYIIVHLMHKTASTLKIAWIDRLAGALFSCIKYLFVISLALNLYITLYGYVKAGEPVRFKGVCYDKAVRFAPNILDYAKKYGISVVKR